MTGFAYVGRICQGDSTSASKTLDTFCTLLGGTTFRLPLQQTETPSLEATADDAIEHCPSQSSKSSTPPTTAWPAPFNVAYSVELLTLLDDAWNVLAGIGVAWRAHLAKPRLDHPKQLLGVSHGRRVGAAAVPRYRAAAEAPALPQQAPWAHKLLADL